MPVSEGVGKARINSFMQDRIALVSKVPTTDDLKGDILKSVDLIGGLGEVVKSGDEVWLKPNFNTSDTPPGSSDPNFVKAMIELLYEQGAGKVIVGESSMMSASTRKVFEETGMLKEAADAGAEVVFFDEDEWVKVSTGGKYLKTASLPEKALAAKRLVYVCCIKTHRWAKFTMSLKLAVGFMKPRERVRLHLKNIQEKIADLNLVTHPDIIIMDGRRCFISGGPACGELRNPNVVMASGDRIAIDVEAIKVIQSYEGTSLTEDPWSYAQIRRAADLRLGVGTDEEYRVVR